MNRVIASLLALVLAGCLAGPSSDGTDPTSGEPSPTGPIGGTPGGPTGHPNPPPTSSPPGPTVAETLALRTVVHAPGGVPLHASNFLWRLPDVQHRYVGNTNALEPTLGVNAAGAAFYVTIGPGLRPEVYRSRDAGESWTAVGPNIAGVVPYPVYTNDPFVYVDPATGRVFSVEMDIDADCLTIQWSDDEGQTWQTDLTDACIAPQEGHDHQSIVASAPRQAQTSGYANVITYCVNNGRGECYTSLDGGLDFTGPVYTGLDVCGGLVGHVAAAPNGTLYVGQVGCDTSEDANPIMVSRSLDDGRTWKATLVSQDWNTSAAHPSSGLQAHELRIAVDAAGNVYVVWLDRDTLPNLAISRDGGETWTGPIAVGRPGLTGATLASVAAGAEGRIAILYVGTTAPGGHAPTQESTATWNAYIAVTHDALAQRPVFATTSANALDDPVKRGTCSQRCNGDGAFEGMFDFLDIEIDPTTGRIWAALVDVCNDACAQPGATSDAAATGRAAVAVQKGGTGLLGYDL